MVTKARPQLTQARIVDAALKIVDAEGIHALSMRRLGRELGVEAMSLYEYVRNKDELLDALAGRLLEELALPTRARGGWKTQIRAVVRAWLHLIEAHPNALPVLYRQRRFLVRDLLFPEEVYAALRRAGFDERATVTAYGAIALFVNGALMRGSPATSGTSSRWDEAPPIDESAFPHIVELLPQARPLDWQTLFDRGLELILDGLDAQLRAGRRGSGRRSVT